MKVPADGYTRRVALQDADPVVDPVHDIEIALLRNAGERDVPHGSSQSRVLRERRRPGLVRNLFVGRVP